jgi:hypothetical protein
MPVPAQANVFDSDKLPFLMQSRQQQQSPLELQKRTSALEEFLKQVDPGAAYVTPIPLHGIPIPGLTSKTVDTLGFNNFVIVNYPKDARMSDVYRENRLNGKANFVTTDCLLHPYLAFSNRVLADTAEKYITSDLRQLLQAMLEQSAIDYNGTDNQDVREDIEKNVAYLCVALKLLDPGYEVLNLGRVRTLVDHDLRHINAANQGISDIFDREEDFRGFRPFGWYNSSEGLANFYRAREWLARMAFPISDVTIGSGTNKSNNFRRSVLLFRSLELAKVDDKPALIFWERVLKQLSLLAPQPNTWRERVLYPGDYKLVFKNDANNLRDTLNGLSEPFYRTKLLLAVRRQKPMNLNSTSIFDMDGGATPQEAGAIFRLFPVTGDPEITWMQSVAKLYPCDQEGGTWWPVALASLSSWGSGQAGNLLLENKVALDPGLNKTYSELYRSIMTRTASGQQQPIASRQRQIFAHYFKPFPDAVQTSLRSEMWLTHRLESAFAAWLDSVTCIAPRHVATAAPARATAPANAAAPARAGNSPIVGASQWQAATGVSPAGPATGASPTQPAAGTTRIYTRRQAPASYHFLEPDPALFAAIQADATALTQTLTELGYLQDHQRHRFTDFIRLAGRLQSIADTQATDRPLSPADNNLLGSIDTVLEKVDVPLPAVLAFPGNQTDSRFKQHPGAGFNIALGRPGFLHIVIQNPRTQDWTLARGAVYSYYEFSGQPVTLADWQRTLSYGQARPPAWTRQFDILQPIRTTADRTASREQQ